jgi:hypothetical protein
MAAAKRKTRKTTRLSRGGDPTGKALLAALANMKRDGAFQLPP